MTIQVELNGERTTLDASITLDQAVARWSSGDTAVAVAVNRQFVPRSRYAEVRLQDGDEVELLSPMQGG